ncbi:MAG: 30S ribosomal protein S4 [archaeon]|nr:30S ribosomal protein S4 [Nanoarchaeota archaeon]
MGDPKKFRKKYETPNHPWNKNAIEEQKVLMREYGLSNKKELYLANSFVKKYRKIAKTLIVDTSKQAIKEKDQMMIKLQALGLLSSDAKLDDVLSLELKDILERRLQTLVFRKGLARSAKQARQFITHRHIMVDGKEINAPGYLVLLKEEAQLQFKQNSALNSEDHPERSIAKQVEEIKEEAEKLKKDIKAKKVKKVDEPLLAETATDDIELVEKSDEIEIPDEDIVEKEE